MSKKAIIGSGVGVLVVIIAIILILNGGGSGDIVGTWRVGRDNGGQIRYVEVFQKV